MADNKTYRGEEAEYAFEALAKQHQYVMLGDSDHRDPDVYRQAIATMDALAKGGVKHLFLEIPSEHQDSIDIILNILKDYPDLSRKDRWSFIRDSVNGKYGKALGALSHWQIDGLADMIEQADAHGIKVHCADVDPITLNKPHPDANTLFHALRNRHTELSIDKAIPIISQELLQEGVLSESRLTKAFKDLRDILKPRYEADPKIAAFIRHTADGEKSAVFFGEGHIGGKYDLDEMLPDTVSVSIRSSDSSFCQNLDFAYLVDKDQFMSKNRYPHQHCMDVDGTYKPPPHSQHSLNKVAPR